MKDKKKVSQVASVFAFVTLVVLILASLATIFVAKTSATLSSKHFPGFFETLFFTKNYLGTEHGMYATGQILNNLVAYFFMLSAVLLFVFSLALIKHSPSLKLKSALLALFLFVPATLGLTGGFIDYIGHGLKLLTNSGSTKDAVIALMMIVVYALDFVYYIAAIVFLVIAVKTTLKVNRGELPLEEEVASDSKEESAEEKQRREEEEAQKRAELLSDIRTIVREELDRLDRIVIAKEVEVRKEVEVKKEEPKPEPKPEPEQVKEEVEEPKQDDSKLTIQRVPFVEKIVKADKEVQEKYNELKNEILAYGASSRISIGGDTFRLHRKSYVKITLVGKTLKVYFALNPRDYADSPIPVFDASDKSAYEDVPSLLKVRSNLSLKRAKELVAAAFAADGVEKKEEAGNHNFVKDIRADLKKNK